MNGWGKIIAVLIAIITINLIGNLVIYNDAKCMIAHCVIEK